MPFPLPLIHACSAKSKRHNRMQERTIRRVHGRRTFICRARKGLKMLDALERVLKGLKPVGRFSLPGFDRNQFVAILLPGNERSRESTMPHGTSTLRINSPLSPPMFVAGIKGSWVSRAVSPVCGAPNRFLSDVHTIGRNK